MYRVRQFYPDRYIFLANGTNNFARFLVFIAEWLYFYYNNNTESYISPEIVIFFPVPLFWNTNRLPFLIAL